MNRFAFMALGMLVACGGDERTRTGGAGRGRGDGGTRHDQLAGEAVAKFDQAVRAYREAATAGWNEARCTNVADLFQEAAEEQEGGNFHEAWFNRGMSFHNCGKSEEATEAFRRSLQAKDAFGPPRVMLGIYAHRRGNAGEAFRMFEQTIRNDPQNVEAYTNLAMLQRERNQGRDGTESLSNIRRALAVDAQYMPAFNQLALLYLGQAEDERATLQLASVVCKQGTQIDANYAPIWNTWGLVNMQEGSIIGALAKFEKAFQLNDRFFEAYMNFGAITLSFRGYEDAKTAFTKAMGLNRRSYEAHIGLGVALRGLDQVEPAKVEYEAAKDIDSARPDSYFNLGILYQDYMSGSVEEFQKAKQYLNEFSQRAQGRPQYADNVRASQQRVRNIDETIAALREGMELQRIADQQAARQAVEDARICREDPANCPTNLEGVPPEEGAEPAPAPAPAPAASASAGPTKAP